MNRKKVLLTVLVVAGIFIAFQVVFAGPFGLKQGGGGPMGGPMFGHMMGGQQLTTLELTDEQKALAEEILTKAKTDGEIYTTELDEKRTAMHDALAADTFVESDVRAIIEEMSAIHEELMIIRAKSFNEIKGILTEDQLATFKEAVENMEAMRDQHMGGKRDMMEHWLYGVLGIELDEDEAAVDTESTVTSTTDTATAEE